MERQKKSCSCWGFFAKKPHKTADQGTDSRQALRSSLISFSNNRFSTDENGLNNSLSSTQKLQSNIPFAQTLTSPLCRTPSMFQFSGVSMRDDSEKPGSSVKPLESEEFGVRRNSVPLCSFEEISEGKEKVCEEKKGFEGSKEKIQSTENSVLVKEQKFEVGGLGGKVEGEIRAKMNGLGLEESKLVKVEETGARKVGQEVLGLGFKPLVAQNLGWARPVIQVFNPFPQEPGAYLGVSNGENELKNPQKDSELLIPAENITQVTPVTVSVSKPEESIFSAPLKIIPVSNSSEVRSSAQLSTFPVSNSTEGILPAISTINSDSKPAESIFSAPSTINSDSKPAESIFSAPATTIPVSNSKENIFSAPATTIPVSNSKENVFSAPATTIPVSNSKENIFSAPATITPVSNSKENISSVTLPVIPENISRSPASIPPESIYPVPPNTNQASNLPFPVLIPEKTQTIPTKPFEEKVKIFPEPPNPFQSISKEEPVINLKTEKFQIDVLISKQEEPVFLKIGPKADQSDDLIDPDFSSPHMPIVKSVNVLPALPTSPKLNILRNPEPILESNIFIKGAAKKSFENLINRFSSDKKLQSLADKIKITQPKLEENAKIFQSSKILEISEESVKIPQHIEMKFKNSQEILKEMYINPTAPKKHSTPKTFEENKSCPKDRPQLNHSKSLSVNNTIVTHDSKEHSKRLSFFSKDFDVSYFGKLPKCDSKDSQGSLNSILSPRLYNKRLPSLKISPIKSILSADDYSDILSFLKNSPREPVKKVPEIEAKKYKLPALKPITPHYFHKKRSAPQIKTKARMLIEHL